eukprot:769350-Prymnesium_polylepis.1
MRRLLLPHAVELPGRISGLGAPLQLFARCYRQRLRARANQASHARGAVAGSRACDASLCDDATPA